MIHSPELLFSRIHRESIEHPLQPHPPHALNFLCLRYFSNEKYLPWINCLKTGAVATTASLQSTESPDKSIFSLTDFISAIFTSEDFSSVSIMVSSCFSFSLMLSNFVRPSFRFSPILHLKHCINYQNKFRNPSHRNLPYKANLKTKLLLTCRNSSVVASLDEISSLNFALTVSSAFMRSWCWSLFFKNY